MSPELRIGQEIRSTHPDAYHSGEWGEIVGVSELKHKAADGSVYYRPGYQIIWPNGDTDIWPTQGSTSWYEFRGEPLQMEFEPGPPESHPGHSWQLIHGRSRMGLELADRLRIHCSCGWVSTWRTVPPDALAEWVSHTRSLG
jgi:hypothetical protein